MADERIVMSACLAGVACRFDGESKPHPEAIRLLREGPVVLVCPEQLAGLPTPRPRHEIQRGRVMSEHGCDATDLFERGAREAARIASLAQCTVAIVKARSPSCGAGLVYDGTFSGALVPGDGLFVRRLRELGLRVLTEDDLSG